MKLLTLTVFFVLMLTMAFSGATYAVTDVSTLATGGNGTVGNQWSGWEASVNNLAANTKIYFPAGYYTQTTTINAKIGWWMEGDGREASYITYTGTGVAINADGAPSGLTWRGKISNLKLTTSSGTHGIRIKDLADYELDRVWVRGFSTAGVHINSTTGLYAISIRIHDCTIEENTGDGVLASGINAGMNHIVFKDSRIRGNTGYGITCTNDIRDWVIDGNDLEANGAGAINLPWPSGLLIHGNYFEQSSGFAIRIQPASAVLTPNGISIVGNHISGGGQAGQTAVILGDNGLTYGVVGVTVVGNFFGSAWTTAIDPIDVRGGVFGPNQVSGSTTHVGTPGASSNGIVVYNSDQERHYAGTSNTPKHRFDGILQQNTAVTAVARAGDLYKKNNTAIRWANSSDTGFGSTLKASYYSVANNGTANIGMLNGPIMIVDDEGNNAMYNLRGGNNAVNELLDPMGVYTPTAGTASRTNIYYNSTNVAYDLENKRGATRFYVILYFGTSQ